MAHFYTHPEIVSIAIHSVWNLKLVFKNYDYIQTNLYVSYSCQKVYIHLFIFYL